WCRKTDMLRERHNNRRSHARLSRNIPHHRLHWGAPGYTCASIGTVRSRPPHVIGGSAQGLTFAAGWDRTPAQHRKRLSALKWRNPTHAPASLLLLPFESSAQRREVDSASFLIRDQREKRAFSTNLNGTRRFGVPDIT